MSVTFISIPTTLSQCSALVFVLIICAKSNLTTTATTIPPTLWKLTWLHYRRNAQEPSQGARNSRQCMAIDPVVLRRRPERTSDDGPSRAGNGVLDFTSSIYINIFKLIYTRNRV
ncbi:hypothetical protein M378DRAFT_579245 [Amanita muscaria Koide BX008]|uniref:Uncharacterized protein n=1 Tax=Amanita muscaria (strain Koide BX008) TaxID=946122 RepID=A0A0C2SMY2_AMAMK|nr:hypothetical protein M378DRAFT_579245 [Amanita muscaria Koide BX008]